MTTENPNTSDLDYSEAMINIQKFHRKMQKELLRHDYIAARDTARKIAVEAMLIGVWCKQFVDKRNKAA